MLLVDLSIRGYMDLLASDASAPGGGSASALMGAQGAALTAMVCALTLGKKKYAQHEELCLRVREDCQKLKDRFLDVLDRDTQAFNAVTAVFAMPRETEAEKAARKEAMQAALKGCTRTPFEMMEYALQALILTREIIGKSNESAASDLGVAAQSLKAAATGAWYNIRINLGGITDEAFTARYQSDGEALLGQALNLAREIEESVSRLL